MAGQQAKHKVAVVIPFYKDTLSAHEAIALQQCFKVLANYPVIAVKPNHLTLPAAITAYPFADTISFDDDYFKDIKGYNALMLSDKFYKEFLGYEYILIHQLDAFVFRDELNYWCDQNYDYIGAPWLRDCDHPDWIKAVKSNIKYFFHIRYDIYVNGEPSHYQFENKVGNGGFSLRRVKKFYDISVAKKEFIAGYLANDSTHFNEDRFWSIEVNRKRKALRIPYYKTGIKFSFEYVLDRAMSLTNNQLPFGCHAWDEHLDFWRPFFKECGYDI
ncbi:DUF5672 family protein [Mucilaginibacter sp.]|uniref:DUF5672 family protein n=1 Tax=Mucilaginibacter sp. TaxID=1882438 RepID=UPI00262F2DBE|nr:DUF5672 family protein [Mucilaginibacter sp.]MDB5031051.1 hypothetical protein [Mucilaginibacter sp.]